MQSLTLEGQRKAAEIAQRYGLSTDAVLTLLSALMQGNCTQAQFSHPELGGMGQWMQGGMVMVGDMFNSNLRAIVDNVCQELCRLIANQNLFLTTQSGQFFGVGNNWWGQDLGSPSSSGSQNNIRYAYFSYTRRLAVEVGGHVTIYDTQDHQISGVSQQQGLGSSLTFTSQYGIVNTGELRIISVDGVPFEKQQNPQPPFQSQPVSQNSQTYEDVFTKIEKLAELRQKGILSDDEFNAKKADLLSKV